MDPLMPWNKHNDMEQGLLSDFFTSTGHVPAHRLEWIWNAKDAPDVYLDRAKIVHSRYVYFSLLLIVDGGLMIPINQSSVLNGGEHLDRWRVSGKLLLEKILLHCDTL